MLKPVSHYFHAEDDAEVAICGHRRQDDERHTLRPTCPTCADFLAGELAAEDQRVTLFATVLDRVYAAMGERR